MRFRLLLYTLLFVGGFSLQAQGPERFRSEIEKFAKEDSKVDKKNLILFTGSSSIRMWSDLSERFPGHNILNRGFGGSDMSDLLYFDDELIYKHNPAKIFIYEGDNDTNAGKTPEEILASADSLLNNIRRKLPNDVHVYFISAKPSIARWSLKDKYIDFNQKLKEWTEEKANVEFIDVWTPMLTPDGEVMQDIFLSDNLHMTPKGYDIWEAVIRRYLDDMR